MLVYPADAVTALGEPAELESPHQAAISAVAFSADGNLLCTADKRAAGGNIVIWDMTASPPAVKSEGWVYHTAAGVQTQTHAIAKNCIARVQIQSGSPVTSPIVCSN